LQGTASARSEAQLAADSAALSAARALANSGMTSNPADTDLTADAERIATNLALQVATNNEVGGRNLLGAVNCANEVCVAFNDNDANFATDPRVSFLSPDFHLLTKPSQHRLPVVTGCGAINRGLGRSRTKTFAHTQLSSSFTGCDMASIQ
jgi:hypothetical protein